METPFPAYQGNAPYIFVSYSHEDSDVVYAEIQWLHDQGFNIWYDQGINPGSEWHSALAESIDNASLFLYFVTPNSVASDHCQREVHYAIDHKKQLLTVHLEPTELPSGLGLSLSSIQAILRHELPVGDYRLKLLKGTSDHIQRGVAQVGLPTVQIQRIGLGMMTAVALVAFLVGALATFGLTRVFAPAGLPDRNSLKRFVIDLDPGDPRGVGQSLAISGDGNRIVFIGVNDSGRQLYMRSLSELDAVPIRGTSAVTGRDGAGSFALSPDNEWVVFNSPSDLSMKKVRLTGGTPITLTSVGDTGQRGLDWGSKDLIVITPASYMGLTKVSARGGKTEPLTHPGPGIYHSEPWFLPDGVRLLYTTGSQNRSGATEIALLDTASGEERVLLEGSYPRLATTGHLLFLRDGSIWAAGFDLVRGEVTTEAVPVVEGVARYSVSNEGTLVYWGGEVTTGFGAPMSELVWLDKQGGEERVEVAVDRYTDPAISPDGKQIALIIATSKGVRDIWVYSIERGTMTRLTFSDTAEGALVWSPDSKQIAYATDESLEADEGVCIYALLADGTGSPRKLTKAAKGSSHIPRSWSERGFLIFSLCADGRSCDPSLVHLDGDHAIEPILSSDFNEDLVSISPDGKWIVYDSNESGRTQIFVRPYPDTGSGRWQISKDGGSLPRWSPDGREIYYAGSSDMMAVRVDDRGTIVADTPRSLFSLNDYDVQFSGYSLSPDGKRFLMTKRMDRDMAKAVIVENWFAELKRLVPTEE